MNDPELRAELDRLQGELLATQALIRSLLISHPDPQHAIAVAHDEAEKLAALALGRGVSDGVVSGIARARKVLFPSPASLRAHD